MSDPAPLFELPEELAIDTGVARRIIAEFIRAQLRQAGFEVVNVLIRNGDTPEDVVGRAVEQGPFDALLIGAGVRLVADNTLLFEGLVNLLHAAYPNARFVFNQAAVTSPDDINRWFEGPEAKAPLR